MIIMTTRLGKTRTTLWKSFRQHQIFWEADADLGRILCFEGVHICNAALHHGYSRRMIAKSALRTLVGIGPKSWYQTPLSVSLRLRW